MNSRTNKYLLLVILSGLILGVFSLTDWGSKLIMQIDGFSHTSQSPVIIIPTNLFLELYRLADVDNRNRQLAQENSELKSRIVNLERSQQVIDLAGKWDVKPESIVNVLDAASTISDGYLYINRGEDQGVKVGDLLVKDYYLIGVIEKVTTDYSVVRCVTSNALKLAVKVNNTIGLSQGISNLSIEVGQLAAAAKIELNDKIKIMPTKDNPMLGNYSLGRVKRKLTVELDNSQVVEVDYPIVISQLENAVIVSH